MHEIARAVQFSNMFKDAEHLVLIEQPRGATHDAIDQAAARLADLGIRADWTNLSRIHSRAVAGTLTISTEDFQYHLPAVATLTTTPADITLLRHDEYTILLTYRVTLAHAQALRDHGWGGYVSRSGTSLLGSSPVPEAHA